MCAIYITPTSSVRQGPRGSVVLGFRKRTSRAPCAWDQRPWLAHWIRGCRSNSAIDPASLHSWPAARTRSGTSADSRSAASWRYLSPSRRASPAP